MQNWEDFEIIKQLGKQESRKFGQTFLVKRKNEKEKLVLKLVKHHKENDLIKNQLKSESSFHFHFPFLPKVIDFQSDESKSFLLLKYKEGVTLDVYFTQLKRKERIPFLKHFSHCLIPIFEELKERNIAHCDVKPSNFIVDRHQNIHLIDFGLAIDFSVKNKRKLIFPLGYAAPELLLNHLTLVNQQTDFYSLGVLFWRLFTKRLPLLHSNPVIFTNLQLNHPIPSDSQVPKKLQVLINEMTIKHSFSIPPNKMPIETVQSYLEKARSFRPKTIREIDEKIQQLKNKRFWI